jgi:replicative DNA helicase
VTARPSDTAAERAVTSLTGAPTPGVEWWLPELTDLIGPLRPGRFAIIGAQSKTGKSTWAVNLLDWLATKTPLSVAYVSTEVSAEEVWTWWGALRAGCPLSALEEGSASDRDRAAVAKQVTMLGTWYDGKVYIPERLTSPSVPDLARVLREHEASGWRTDVLVLDHVHRTSPGKNQSMHEHITKTAGWLKDLTLDDRYPVSVVCMAQLKRAGANERIARYLRPYMEQLAWSAALEQNADVVLGLSRSMRQIDAHTRAMLLRGDADPDQYAEHGVMRMTCLAHRRKGSAMDRSIKARLDGARLVPYQGMPDVPTNGGDSWEPDERVPF